MPETKEVLMRFRIDDIVPEPNRTKLFFIIHQAMLDGSLNFGGPITITNYKYEVDPYSKDQEYMNLTKIHNQLSQHLYGVIDKYNIPVNRDKYYLVKLFGNVDNEIITNGSIIYLPQTNQMVIYNDDWKPEILLSHEYAFVIQSDTYQKYESYHQSIGQMEQH